MHAIATECRKDYTIAAMLTGSQIRAARALLGWTTHQLADASATSYATVSRAEQHEGVPPIRATTLHAIQTALEDAGVTFVPKGYYAADGGAGVRLR